MEFSSIPACFAAQARRNPDAVAVSEKDCRLTYRELADRAHLLAHRLRELGVAPGHAVAVDMTHSVDLVVAILAVLDAGASYLPLHAANPPRRSQEIIDRIGARVLIADGATQARGLARAEATVFADYEWEYPETAPAWPSSTGLDDIAYVMHTSGTTGRPKGVAVTHRGVLGLALDSCWDGGRHAVVPMLAPFAFGVSTYEIWVPLLRGGRLVIPPPGRLDVRVLRELIATEGITGLHLTAGLFRVIAEEDPGCLAGVREVITGGDVIAPKAVQHVLDTNPGLIVRAMYGGTEVSSFATTSEMVAPYRAGSSVPLGRALDGVTLHVLDADLRPVAVGEVGDLYIGGQRLGLGYVGGGELTATRFVADPFAGGGARMYRTGDLVRWTEDGLIDFVARATDQVKIRGYRVEIGEVEAALADGPGVAQAAVLVKRSSSGESGLIAYVVPAGKSIDISAVRDAVASRLPDYMVPSAIVELGALPLTPNGKLDRAALPDPVPGVPSSYRAPGSARQERLCHLFAEVLGAERVGMDDSFFELDGQSLLAMRLINQIDAELAVELSIADLFDAPTVGDLDQLISDRER